MGNGSAAGGVRGLGGRGGRRLELVPAFVRLLKDNEAEVRVAAAAKLSAFCGILEGEAVVAALLPCIKDLSTDGSQVPPPPYAILQHPCLAGLTQSADVVMCIHRSYIKPCPTS